MHWSTNSSPSNLRLHLFRIGQLQQQYSRKTKFLIFKTWSETRIMLTAFIFPIGTYSISLRDQFCSWDSKKWVYAGKFKGQVCDWYGCASKRTKQWLTDIKAEAVLYRCRVTVDFLRSYLSWFLHRFWDILYTITFVWQRVNLLLQPINVSATSRFRKQGGLLEA